MATKVRLLLVLSIVAILSLIGSFYIAPQRSDQPYLGDSKPELHEGLKDSTNRNVKVTLASSSNKNVTKYINLASNAENSNQAYSYYIKAYNELNKEYNSSADLKVKLALIRLASFISTLPQYKQGDIAIPK